MRLSSEVRGNLTNIVSGLSPNAPGDNRVALAISRLQYEKFMDRGRSTIEEHFLKSIGHIGVETGKARLDAEQAEGILVQMQGIRGSD